MGNINPWIDWQWFEYFGEKCETCRGVKNVPKPHPSDLQECTCNLARRYSTTKILNLGELNGK